MNIRSLFATKTRRRVAIVLAVILVPAVLYKLVYPLFFEAYTGVKNAPLTYDTRKLSDDEFEQLALELTQQARRERAAATVREDQDDFAREVKIDILMNTPSFFEEADYQHIEYFRKAGIREYQGPETCLQCHETIDITHEDGTVETVDTLENIVNTVHFKFQSAAGGAFSTYGYDGRRVNAENARKIPVGKINRACGIPGSFSWTGWAALVESRPEHALAAEAQSSPIDDGAGGEAAAG
ncbi:MAG: nitrite reductase, partial [Halochromatium sp.]